jgi:hypothetical protein
MKRIVYLKVSSKTNQVSASYSKNYKPLSRLYAKRISEEYYPTLMIKLNLDIPDEFFSKADKEIDLKISELDICNDIIVEENKKEKME